MTFPQEPSKGQETSDPSIVDLLEKHTRALVRITAVLTKLSGRLDALEDRLSMPTSNGSESADDGPTHEDQGDEPHHVDESPPLALRCDGKILLNIGEIEGDLIAYELASYQRWTGIVLPESDARDLFDLLGDGFSGAAGSIGGDIIRRARAKRDPEGGLQ